MCKKIKMIIKHIYYCYDGVKIIIDLVFWIKDIWV